MNIATLRVIIYIINQIFISVDCLRIIKIKVIFMIIIYDYAIKYKYTNIQIEIYVNICKYMLIVYMTFKRYKKTSQSE
jgi:hypothetical protein